MAKKINNWSVALRFLLMLAALVGVLWTISELKSGALQQSNSPVVEVMTGASPEKGR